MRSFRRLPSVFFIAVVFASAAALSGCGGGATGPSGSQGVSLRGTVSGFGAVAAADVAAMSSSVDAITVTVQENPAITTRVGSDGTFTLRGLPEGSFTLVFTNGSGAVLGTLRFTELKPNQELTITIKVTDNAVTLLDERRNGIGHGGIEIEGLVREVGVLDPSGESIFNIEGYRVIARPGVTAIRQGNRSVSVTEVTAGRRVHVKGEWLAATNGPSQPVLAHEIKLQGGEDDDDDEGEPGEAKITICHKGKNTLTVGASAWPAHRAHGDTMGPCK
jgi:hypothetical protein